jgi:hypothetical protein
LTRPNVVRIAHSDHAGAFAFFEKLTGAQIAINRIAKEPTSSPGINADYRRTHHFHEMPRPDIFLGAHAEWFNYEQKRDRAKSEGVRAWVNPEEYRQFVAKQKRAFEDDVDLEMGLAPDCFMLSSRCATWWHTAARTCTDR